MACYDHALVGRQTCPLGAPSCPGHGATQSASLGSIQAYFTATMLISDLQATMPQAVAVVSLLGLRAKLAFAGSIPAFFLAAGL